MNISEMVQAETDSDEREDARLLLGKVFERAVQTNMDDQEWDCLAEVYLASSPELQGLINYVMISVCGHSVPTLIKLAELGDDIVWENDGILVETEHANDIDWNESHCPRTEPLAATVTVDPNHRSVIIMKMFRDFETADAEGKKKINARLKELGAIGPNLEIIGVGNSNESQTERMAKLRRERKRARFHVVSSDETSAQKSNET
jgi:hypothetical protein